MEKHLTSTVFVTPGTKYPESINRVMDLTGKHVTFHEADLCNKDSLRQVATVINRMIRMVKKGKHVSFYEVDLCNKDSFATGSYNDK